jgi:Tfp pilus assembly protein PilO
MIKIPKEKQYHLILVAVATAGAIAGLWFGVISAQKAKRTEIARNTEKVRHDIERVQREVLHAADLENELAESTNRLSKIESTMPNGDLFSWIVSTVKQFNTPDFKVDMPQFGPPAQSEVLMFPKYPYNQALVNVSGTAYYHDLGKFLAEFENHFPYMRVQNLSLDPGAAASADDKEKLFFRMDIVSLTKPGPS